jgi:hypothetical protein
MKQRLLGISFDGLPISGIVNAFIDTAGIFAELGYEVLLDLGYQIAPANAGLADLSPLPEWIEQTSILSSVARPNYTPEAIYSAANLVRLGTDALSIPGFRDLILDLAAAIEAFFHKEQIRWLIVENGTLPDNPLFTAALDIAIDRYGSREIQGTFVLWRDHDMMWSSLPKSYGPFPYPGVRRPRQSEFIAHVVLNNWMKTRLLAWEPSAQIGVIPSCFHQPKATHGLDFRKYFTIPSDAILIARCTRVIQPKWIGLDLRLLDLLQSELQNLGDQRQVFLFITGPTAEDQSEYLRLLEIQRTLKCTNQVIWGNGLSRTARSDSDRPSIQDLLAVADLSSFLTSYDYEGFGNPPGEAMAAGIPYISTTYEVYHDVYGSKGAIAPLLPIGRDSQEADPIPAAFIQSTLRLLIDSNYRQSIAKHNLAIADLHFSHDAHRKKIQKILQVESPEGAGFQGIQNL